jgi:hypothetical protein
MNEKSTTQRLQFELLLKHGYRPDQPVPDSNGAGFRCSPDDLPVAIALVENPHGLTVTDEMKSAGSTIDTEWIQAPSFLC